eukprot:183269_1
MFEVYEINDGNNPYIIATYNSDFQVIMRHDAKNKVIEYFIPSLVTIDFTQLSEKEQWRYSPINTKYTFLDYNYYQKIYSFNWNFGEIDAFLINNSVALYDTPHEKNDYILYVTDDICKWCRHATTLNQCSDCHGTFLQKAHAPDLYIPIINFTANDIDDIISIPYSNELKISYIQCNIGIDIQPSDIEVGSNETLRIIPQVSNICKDKPLIYDDASDYVFFNIDEHNDYLEKFPFFIYMNSTIGNINHYITVQIRDIDLKCNICNQQNKCIDCSTGIKLNFSREIKNKTSFFINLFAQKNYKRNKYEQWYNVPIASIYSRYRCEEINNGPCPIYPTDSLVWLKQDLQIDERNYEITASLPKPNTIIKYIGDSFKDNYLFIALLSFIFLTSILSLLALIYNKKPNTKT